jgi:hypothetical protein
VLSLPSERSRMPWLLSATKALLLVTTPPIRGWPSLGRIGRAARMKRRSTNGSTRFIKARRPCAVAAGLAAVARQHSCEDVRLLPSLDANVRTLWVSDLIDGFGSFLCCRRWLERKKKGSYAKNRKKPALRPMQVTINRSTHRSNRSINDRSPRRLLTLRVGVVRAVAPLTRTPAPTSRSATGSATAGIGWTSFRGRFARRIPTRRSASGRRAPASVL